MSPYRFQTRPGVSRKCCNGRGGFFLAIRIGVDDGRPNEYSFIPCRFCRVEDAKALAMFLPRPTDRSGAQMAAAILAVALGIMTVTAFGFQSKADRCHEALKVVSAAIPSTLPLPSALKVPKPFIPVSRDTDTNGDWVNTNVQSQDGTFLTCNRHSKSCTFLLTFKDVELTGMAADCSLPGAHVFYQGKCVY